MLQGRQVLLFEPNAKYQLDEELINPYSPKGGLERPHYPYSAWKGYFFTPNFQWEKKGETEKNKTIQSKGGLFWPQK